MPVNGLALAVVRPYMVQRKGISMQDRIIQLPNGKPATVPLDIDGWVGGLIG